MTNASALLVHKNAIKFNSVFLGTLHSKVKSLQNDNNDNNDD